MAAQGYTDHDIYTKLNISKDSFYEYKKNFPEFSDLFTAAEIELVEIAKQSLLKKLAGFEYDEIKTEVTKGLVDISKVSRTKKFIPPDTRAIEFFLCSRDKSGGWTRVDKKEEIIDEFDDEFYDLDNIKLVPHFEKWFNEEYDKHLFSILKGGRGSGKSTSAARRYVKDILKYPINILVMRKNHNTISTSVYEELVQAINDLGVRDEFRCVGGDKPSIRRIRTGQRFIFVGGAEPEKIKSIKTSKFPIARLWIEELVEFRSYEEVKVIIDSIVRAKLPEGLTYHIIFTYNPPKRKAHWCNKLYNTQFIPENTCIDHSTSFVNPYLSTDFLEEADNVKAKNEARWRWNYGGEAIGGGIVPFSNLEFRPITDVEILRFDNICQGIDWGFAADPLCFLRGYFDKTRFILYIYAEIYQVKMSNKILAEKIIERRYNDYVIIADSEDPKSIDDVKSYGIRCRGAKKGPGSVEHGLEWLDSLEAIIIDPERCPNTAKEFEDIDYQTDKDGNVISKLDDKNDHSIDCARYMTEEYQYSKRKFFPSRR
ncbi:MAG: PBSX family phage terminase large subunit [Candidatus Paceibacterota bacterium]